MKPRYLLAILSGLLIGTSYIPFPPWAIFFCFIPLWQAWLAHCDSYKQIFWTGWITQFVLTLIGFNWVSYTVNEFGHIPWPLAILVLLAFCSFANLYVPLAGLVWQFARKRLKLGDGASIAALAVFMSVGERIFPMIFDWHFGYTWLYAGFPAFHLADIIGFIGLSNVGLAFNAILFWGWRQYKAKNSNWKYWVASVPVAFAVLNALGAWHGPRSTPVPDAKTSFLIVQANVDNQEKLMAEKGSAYRSVVINRFVSLTRQGIENSRSKPAFVVWPETAFPEIITDRLLGFGYPRLLKDAFAQMQVRLITGGYSTLPSTGQTTNSFFVLDEKGEWAAPPYHKTILLAFGEYFPGKDLLPRALIDRYFPEIGDFGRGPGPTVLEAGYGLKIGAQICYEGLFDWFTRRLANDGAGIIVNVTNDSWYGTWMQPYQHLYMTLARAVEVRRPLVRSTNTGISTVILADGKILELSPLHQEWFYLYEVPYAMFPRPTLFMGWGYWLVPGMLALAFLIIAARALRRRR